MTTLTSDRSVSALALAASADRVRHAATAMGRPVLVDDDLVVAWQGDRGLFTNLGVVLTTAPDWDDVLARIERTVPEGRPVSLMAAGEVPDLSPRGWQSVGRPPLMVRPAGGPAPAAVAELTVREALDGAGLEAFERTLVEGYPEPELLPYRWGTFHDERVLGGPTRFLVGWVAEEPVATAVAHTAEGVTMVEMVATLASARGRGYGAAVTWTAATVDPEVPAVLISSDLGRPVYERLGFEAVERWTLWHRPRA